MVTGVETTTQAGRGTLAKPLVLTCFAISGAASLIYEVAWTRELSLVFGSTVYAVSIMLCAFMSGLALGGWIGGRRVDLPGADPVRDYAWLELLIGATAIISMLLIGWLPYQLYLLGGLAHRSWILYFVGQLLLSFLVMLGPTTLMGATFPVVARIVATDMNAFGTAVGSAYSVNTFGSIIGSAGAGFALIPLIGVRYTIVTAILLNILSAMTVAMTLGISGRRRWLARGAATTAAAIVAATILPNPVVQKTLFTMIRTDSHLSNLAARSNTVLRYKDDGPYGRVAVIEYSNGILSLHNGGKVEGSTEKTDQRTMQLAVRLPDSVRASSAGGNRKDSALVIGLGTGFTTQTALKAGYSSVTTVEINPKVVEASRFFVGDAITGSSRHKMAVNDARWYLAANEGTYDLITSEPSWPLSSAVTPLFTLDFFQLVSDRLTEDGAFCQWIPQYLFQDRDFMVMYRTFAQVFPDATVWNCGPDLYLVGVKGGADVDPDRVLELLDSSIPGSKVSAFENTRLLQESLEREDIPLNTDDRPVMETAVARNLIEQLGEASDAVGSDRYRSGLRTN